MSTLIVSSKCILICGIELNLNYHEHNAKDKEIVGVSPIFKLKKLSTHGGESQKC
jgi:hypothetical protein